MELRIYFVGICTHLWWGPPRPGPHITNKVVLVNAHDGARVGRHDIPPHLATLRFRAADIVRTENLELDEPITPIVEWRLEGARVEVENAVGPARTDESYLRCMPHLGTLTPDIGPPSIPVDENAVPELASAYFHVSGGTLSAALNDSGAAIGILEMDTAGGESPRIRITPFVGGTPIVVTLRAGAEVTISNVEAPGVADPFGFLLHYRTAVSIPAHPKVPVRQEAPSGCRVLQRAETWPSGTVGPGCSNTGYP